MDDLSRTGQPALFLRRMVIAHILMILAGVMSLHQPQHPRLTRNTILPGEITLPDGAKAPLSSTMNWLRW
jgi:hypothetical protein